MLLALVGVLGLEYGLSGALALCGWCSSGSGQEPRTTLRSVHSHREAMQLLGLPTDQSPKPHELRQAFRQMVKRIHPDRPGGDASKLQDAKEAYDILSGKIRPTPRGIVKAPVPPPFQGVEHGWVPHNARPPQHAYEVWQEIGYNPYSGHCYGGDNSDRQAPSEEFTPSPAPPPPARPPVESTEGTSWSHYALAGMFALLVGVGPMTVPQPDLVLDEGSQQHGLEYAIAAAVAKTENTPLLLARGLGTSAFELASAKVPIVHGQERQLAVQQRARLVVETLKAALDEPQDEEGPPKFQAIAAVVHEEHLPSIESLLADGQLGHLESSTVSGRKVVRAERSDTGQKVLLVGASQQGNTGRRMEDLKDMIREASPGMVMLDMSEATWLKQCEDFTIWTGADVRSEMQTIDPFDLKGFHPEA